MKGKVDKKTAGLLMKKGQTEIIGLLVIVILLIVLGFIFIRLGFRQEPSFTPEMRTSTMANNLLLAIMRTNTPYGKMTDFIVKSDYNALKQEITLILDRSLPNKKAQFLVDLNGEIVFEIGETCNEPIVATQSFPKNQDVYKLILKIC